MSGATMRMKMLASVAAVAALVFAATPSHALDIKKMTLSNGATVLVSEQHQLPMVTVMIEFDAGTRRDPKGKEGLAELTARCLSQGTKELTAPEFDQKTDFMGSSVGVSAGRDYSTAGMTSLKKYQAETMQLLAGILTEPGLRDADIERKRAEQVAEIKAAEEQPGYTAGVEFSKDLFGDTPYGHPGAGSSDSVAKLTNDDVRGFYHDHYKLGSAIIAVAGDVTADEVKASLEKALAGLAGSVAPQDAPPPINCATRTACEIDRSERDASQHHHGFRRRRALESGFLPAQGDELHPRRRRIFLAAGEGRSQRAWAGVLD